MMLFGNMAVHLTDGRVAVVTDFPTWDRSAVPTGPAALCVISHSHADHFAPTLASAFCGSLLDPKDVIQGAGVEIVALRPEVKWQGITIRPLATSHGEPEGWWYHSTHAGHVALTKAYFDGLGVPRLAA